jgi:hypothetical protein
MLYNALPRRSYRHTFQDFLFQTHKHTTVLSFNSCLHTCWHFWQNFRACSKKVVVAWNGENTIGLHRVDHAQMFASLDGPGISQPVFVGDCMAA